MKSNKQTIQTSIIAFFIAFTISFFMTSCESDPSKKIKKENVASTDERLNSVVDFAVINFEKTNHDFGEIKDGDIVETTFQFSNSGNSDLKILNATGSCGCTVPEYPRDTPIKPGESGTIKVKFDSSNKPGMQRKTVTLTTNTSKGKELLNIKAFVLPKE
ncbi:MAG: DUF1573 domain-containing protein [Flavobacteriaceae bacterium]